MKIGDTFKTKHGNILEVKESTGEFRSNGAEIYILECNICSNEDPELWYYGSIKSDKYCLNRGQTCCGCSKAIYTAKQWKIRLERKCLEKGFDIINYGELKNKMSEVEIHNPITGNIWSTPLHHLINHNRGDPWTYNMGRDDSYHIKDFYKAGLNKEYTFIRSDVKDSQGKLSLWKVYCPVCENTYIRNISDLKAGKVPCDCRKRGYDISAEFGYFYVLMIKVKDKYALKFGITSSAPSRRWKYLISNNDIKSGDLEVKLLLRSTDTQEVRNCETRLKRIFKLEREYLSKKELKDGYTETMKWEDNTLIRIKDYLDFHLPCPAVSHGGKSVEDVLPMLECLPDNVIVYLDK